MVREGPVIITGVRCWTSSSSVDIKALSGLNEHGYHSSTLKHWDVDHEAVGNILFDELLGICNTLPTLGHHTIAGVTVSTIVGLVGPWASIYFNRQVVGAIVGVIV